MNQTANPSFWQAPLLRQARTHWPLALGLLALAVPSVWELWSTLWQSDDQAHGPFVLAIIVWLFWRRQYAVDALPNQSSFLGWPAVILACIAYALGRSQNIYILEVGAFVPLLMGITLLNTGWRGVQTLWFALFFLVFLIPLPGPVVDALTGSLKEHVSNLAETVLYHANYPIARIGVMLTIGNYQLLVADACSGMHSMFTLFAMGLLYLHLQEYPQRLRNILIFLAIAPIAFVANVIRVMILVLVTYYMGDAAGQGFIHNFSGFALFGVALLSLYGIDKLLGLIFRTSTSKEAP